MFVNYSSSVGISYRNFSRIFRVIDFATYRIELEIYHIELAIYHIELAIYLIELAIYHIEISIYLIELAIYLIERVLPPPLPISWHPPCFLFGRY